jgi:uncharacterized membrane protein
MVQFHPPLSGFPLACIVLLWFVELYRFFCKSTAHVEWARSLLVVSSLVFTGGAFLSGYQASAPLDEVGGSIQDALGRHHAYGRLLLINSIAMATFFLVAARAIHGKFVVETLYRLTLLIQILLALWVGSLGGALVFDYGLGVTKEGAALRLTVP